MSDDVADFPKDERPEAALAGARAPMGGDELERHQEDWLTCIGTGMTPNGSIDLGVRVESVISPAEMSERRRHVVNFDAEKRQVSM